VYVRAIAAALGYPQTHPTIIICDNSTAVGLANDTVKVAKTNGRLQPGCHCERHGNPWTDEDHGGGEH